MKIKRCPSAYFCAAVLAWGGSLAVPGAATAQQDQVGEWSGPDPWPIIAIHMAQLPDQRVLAFGSSNDGQGTLWDPVTETFTPMPLAPVNIFCGGHSFLPDGRLLVTGGHINPYVGVADANIFDFTMDTWVSAPPMNDARWYPTNTTLPNGEILVTGGTIDSRQNTNRLPQVWRITGGWRNLTTAQMVLPLYPWMFVAPNGRVFYAGPTRGTRYLATSGTGTWTSVASSSFGYRDKGSAVLYDEGKVLIVGGGGLPANGPPPTATAEVIDLMSGAPRWRYTNPMAFGRRQHNATLLPDGKVLVTGGTSSPGFNNAAGTVLAAEIWDPQTEEWTTVASMSVRRIYHSTAMLLPDGRVIAAGGGAPPATGINPPDQPHRDAEIYSPPYLFQGERPTITSAPSDVVGYNGTFDVFTPQAASIAMVNLISLSAVTHAYNQGQRINRLTFSWAGGDRLTVNTPANANLAPPGYYMLYIVNSVNSNRVPSVAKIIQIE